MPAFSLHPACADVQVADAAAGKVHVAPRRRKVAIIGFATNTLHLVPWFDSDYELWGLNQGHINFHRRADRWFEMHQPEFTADARDPEYLQWLQQCDIPVYMVEQREGVPTSVRYPIEDALKLAGRDYFTSSVAYMLALATMEGFAEIGIFGINLAIGGEYFHEKACAEYWIGLAQGRGAKVYVPAASSLLKQHARYGYSIEPRPNLLIVQHMNERIAAYGKQVLEQSYNRGLLDGAKQEAELLKQMFEGMEVGADVVTQFRPPE